MIVPFHTQPSQQILFLACHWNLVDVKPVGQLKLEIVKVCMCISFNLQIKLAITTFFLVPFSNDSLFLCLGHFGYIELPIPVYHPSHVSELRDLLSLVCLKCLRMKKVPKQSWMLLFCVQCELSVCDVVSAPAQSILFKLLVLCHFDSQCMIVVVHFLETLFDGSSLLVLPSRGCQLLIVVSYILEQKLLLVTFQIVLLGITQDQ